MSTKYPRIQVTNDLELQAAIEKMRAYYKEIGQPDQPVSKIVRDLAIRGSKQLQSDEERRKQLIESLLEKTLNRTGLDWDLLERIDDVAWRHNEFT